MIDRELFGKLIEVIAPSGAEDPVAKIIEEAVKPYADEVYRDTLGNLIAYKKGSGGPKVVLAAHMDEIGFMATNVDEEGYVRFAPIGGQGIWPNIMRPVRFQNGVMGVMHVEGKADWNRLNFSLCYVDIGAKSREEALKRISVGDVFAYDSKLLDMGDCWSGKAMDDRCCCLVLIEALKLMTKPYNDIYCVFTVQEEVGLRGARTTGYSIEPKYAIALDVCYSGDTPKSYPQTCSLGKGPTNKLMDAGIVSHRTVVDWITQAAEKNSIPFQYEILQGGATDVGSIHLERGGIACGAISVACRYVHSCTETISKDDLENAVKLLAACVAMGKD